MNRLDRNKERKWEHYTLYHIKFSLKFIYLLKRTILCLKTKLAKIIVTCLVYGLASALTKRIWMLKCQLP